MIHAFCMGNEKNHEFLPACRNFGEVITFGHSLKNIESIAVRSYLTKPTKSIHVNSPDIHFHLYGAGRQKSNGRLEAG